MKGVVGIEGFPPPTSTSQKWRSIKLSHIPITKVAPNILLERFHQRPNSQQSVYRSGEHTDVRLGIRTQC